jgi:hypothetical protein
MVATRSYFDKLIVPRLPPPNTTGTLPLATANLLS